MPPPTGPRSPGCTVCPPARPPSVSPRPAPRPRCRWFATTSAGCCWVWAKSDPSSAARCTWTSGGCCVGRPPHYTCDRTRPRAWPSPSSSLGWPVCSARAREPPWAARCRSAWRRPTSDSTAANTPARWTGGRSIGTPSRCAWCARRADRRRWQAGTMRLTTQSRKLRGVRYDVRGPILQEAERLEAQGHKILKLNIGNTAPFGFDAPDAILADMIHNLPESQGYSDSRGIYSARTAVAQYYQSHGLRQIDVEDVYIGNGVSELISMVLTTFIDDGNEVLIPAPDYPLWTGAVTLTGGTPVHYRCDEANGWIPDLADIGSKITANTFALVIINPNNPTGAVYGADVVRGLVDIARKHDLVAMADEIYEKIIFDDHVHHHAATFGGDDVLCLTFSGLSKAYRVCGYRAGWVMVSGPKHLATDFLEGLTLLANMRMCANVPGQHAIQTALGGYQSINELIVPGGRFYEQSKLAWNLLNKIPGVTCTEPQGALYCFPRLDPETYPIEDDQEFVIDLLRAKKILVTHGTGFNWFEPDHFRLVTLPAVDILEEAIGRIASYLESLRE